MSNLVQIHKTALLGLSQEEMLAAMVELGEPPFRASQLYANIYRRRQTDFAAMTDLPKTLRRRLAERSVVTASRVESTFQSTDGTRRFLLRLEDEREVEAVAGEVRRPTPSSLKSF